MKNIVSLVPILGQKAVDQIAGELHTLADDQDAPWKGTVLVLLSEAVAAHGSAGVAMAHKALRDVLDKKALSIDWASPQTASDVVALLQNIEAKNKSQMDAFFTKLEQVLNTLFTALLLSLLAV